MPDRKEHAVAGAIGAAPTVLYGLGLWGFEVAVLVYFVLLIPIVLSISAQVGDSDD